VKASPQKGGHGHITSYRLIIGSAAARRCGFVKDDGERPELEIIEVPEEKTVIIKVKEDSPRT
jgi:hypothetical protein